MDTRGKIIDSQAARALIERVERDGGTVRLVCGYFDPVLASHAERLAAAKADGALIIVGLGEPEESILPARARAELVASLGVVDRVLLPGEWEGLPVERRSMEQIDLETRSAFIEHVRRRQL